MEAHNMSDEDFLAAGDDILPEEEEVVEEEIETESEEEEVEEESEGSEEDLEDTEEDDDEEEVDDTTESDDDDSEDTDENESDEDDEESQKADSEEDDDEEDDDTDEDTQETDDFDYKAFHEKVTSGYKANGKMMPGFTDPDDIIAAFSKGANYAHKTTILKPHMKRIQMLKDVTDEELNEMLDFRNREPELLKKALLEAKINPIDLDVDEEIQYTAKDHTVSDAEVELQETLDEIQETETFKQTTQVVTKLWDAKSKKAMMEDPSLIKALNEEMEMGRYDQIQGMIDQNRLLGKGDNMSDLEMYQVIATEMNRAASEAEESVEEEEVPEVKVENPVTKAKQKAAKAKAGIKQKKSTPVKKETKNAATMSDDDFLAWLDSSE